MGRDGFTLVERLRTPTCSGRLTKYGTCDTLRNLAADEIERLEGALDRIKNHWTPSHQKALDEWDGEGTEAFTDVVWMDATSIKPLCDIARAATGGE